MEINLPFESVKFRAIWDEWLQYRRERRLPAYKPIGLKRTFSGLLRDSDGNEDIAIAMIINSIEKNWQGIFKIYGTHNSSTPGNNQGTSAARIETARNW